MILLLKRAEKGTNKGKESESFQHGKQLQSAVIFEQVIQRMIS